MAGRKTYHHGDLKAAVLSVALQSLEEGEQLVPSMRVLANKLGVGHRALYNHYTDREALLIEIAAHGFRQLAHALHGSSEREDHLSTYIAFAIDHPGLYSVMMDRPYGQFENNHGLADAVDKVINASFPALASPNGTDDDRRRAVIGTWMLVHGGVALHRSGALKMRSDKSFGEEMLRIARLFDPASANGLEEKKR